MLPNAVVVGQHAFPLLKTVALSMLVASRLIDFRCIVVNFGEDGSA
jgi:hypothetical protein